MAYRRKEARINERLEGRAERVPSVDRSIEAGLAKLDGAHKGDRTRGGPMRKRKVRMLVTLSDECAQITACKAILGDNPRPNVGVIPNISCKTGRLIRA